MTHEPQTLEPGIEPRIGILVVAYNAATTLTKTLDRIPASFRSRISKILVSDDHSTDETFELGVEYLSGTDLPIEIVHQARNLGYGGNQKAGYHWAIENDLDIVVMLHGDGQYAPELLPDMVQPLVDGRADAVFGSRMLNDGGAREGGMPLYKLIGNKALTKFQNSLCGADLSEWHSGYRAYSVGALKDIPFERNDQGFRFDTQIILQLIEANKRIIEIPIPTFYGDEVCYVNGMKYAREICSDAARFRLHRVGLGSGDLAFGHTYTRTFGPVEQKLLETFQNTGSVRILDLSTEAAAMGRRLIAQGHEVMHLEDLIGIAVDKDDQPLPFDARLDDLEKALAKDEASFDAVIALDLLVRTTDPERVMRLLHNSLRPFGRLFTSVPNIEHWYPRIRIGVGQFDYDQRGILDRSHLRMYSDRSMRRLATRTGWGVKQKNPYGIPFQVLESRTPKRGVLKSAPKWVLKIDSVMAKKWPSLFSYVTLYELEPASPRGTSRATTEHPQPRAVELAIPRKLRSAK